jgi:flagella basal body P-ring formation protein FlgA
MSPALINAAVANAVASAGGPANAAITLPDFAPPMIPPGAAPKITVTRMDFDPGTGNFSASLVVDAAGMAPQNLDLSGLAQASVQAIVASHMLAPGETLNAADLTLALLPENQGQNAITSMANALGMAVTEGVQAGAPVLANNLAAPIVVRKGNFVVLKLLAPGMVLTAQGVALGAGGVGDLIPVLNPASHAVVQAAITGPGSADIAPGSAPLSTPQDNAGYAGYESYAHAHGGYQQVAMQP